MTKYYTVTPIGPGIFQVVDASNGAPVNRFNIPGQIISGPVVVGDQCTIITQANNTKTGYIVKLPTGHIINRFIS